MTRRSEQGGPDRESARSLTAPPPSLQEVLDSEDRPVPPAPPTRNQSRTRTEGSASAPDPTPAEPAVRREAREAPPTPEAPAPAAPPRLRSVGGSAARSGSANPVRGGSPSSQVPPPDVPPPTRPSATTPATGGPTGSQTGGPNGGQVGGLGAPEDQLRHLALSVDAVAAAVIARMREAGEANRRHLEALEAEAARRCELLTAQAELDAELIRLHARREAHAIITAARMRSGEDAGAPEQSRQLDEVVDSFARFTEAFEGRLDAWDLHDDFPDELPDDLPGDHPSGPETP